MKDPMQGVELIKHLAEAEKALTTRLEQARESAARTIAAAEQEQRRILTEAEAQIHQMESESRMKMEMRCAGLASDARRSAEQVARKLRRQAEAKMDRAVEFLLSRVMP